MHPETTLIHALRNFDSGAVVPPVHLASTFEMDVQTCDAQWAYQRGGNPTRAHVEAVIAAIEGAAHGFAFASGMAATTAALSLLKAGDEVILPTAVYGGTFRYVEKYAGRLGLTARFIDDLSRLSDDDFTPATAMVFLETPTNPTLRVVDLQAVAERTHAHGALLAVDNTFMTGLLQRPLDLGADLVVQSATKYLGGHSDLLAGAVTTNRDDLAEQILLNQKVYGGVLEPLTSFRLAQGIKTLALRLERAQDNTHALLDHLKDHPGIRLLHYAGSHSAHERDIHASQARGIGAVFSYTLARGYDLRTFLGALELPAFAVSLGGVESLICLPAFMSHDGMTADARTRAGITDDLVRFSVGIENIEDLRADFDRALDAAKNAGDTTP